MRFVFGFAFGMLIGWMVGQSVLVHSAGVLVIRMQNGGWTLTDEGGAGKCVVGFVAKVEPGASLSAARWTAVDGTFACPAWGLRK